MSKFALLPLAALLAAPAAAQGWPEPMFGAVTLSAGFEDDPNTTSVIAGGSVDISEFDDTCAGYITTVPAVRLDYTAGEHMLLIGVISDSDTTLVINGPNDTWYCDDDSWKDGDPLVVEPKPASGSYQIWVGTFNPDEAPDALVVITENTRYLPQE